jgi:hypothetical protein
MTSPASTSDSRWPPVPRGPVSYALLLALAGMMSAPATSVAQSSAVMEISATMGSARSGRSGSGADLVWDRDSRSWVALDRYLVRYATETTPQRTSIKAEMKYLALLNHGGPIQPISFIYEPFSWGFPILIAEVSNNEPAPLVLNRAIFTMRKSVLDPTPIPVIVPDSFRSNALHSRLQNEGWGELGSLEVNFTLIPLQSIVSPEQYTAPFAHTVSVGSVIESANVDISSAFAQEGIDLKQLPTRQDSMTGKVSDNHPSFGKFKGGGAGMVGRMRYTARTVEGMSVSRTVKFATEVWLYDEFRAGVPPAPSYDYEAKLQVTGQDYSITVPIDKTIPAHGRDRIAIRLGVEKSSVHDFVFTLRSTADSNLVSMPIRMEIFIPRSGAKFIQGR